MFSLKDELTQMMAKKKGKDGGEKVSKESLQAKMEVLKEMLDMAHGEMGGRVKSGMEGLLHGADEGAAELELEPETSVTVSADDQEGLEDGLEMAKNVVSEDPEILPEDKMKDSEDDEETKEDKPKRRLFSMDDEDED